MLGSSSITSTWGRAVVSDSVIDPPSGRLRGSLSWYSRRSARLNRELPGPLDAHGGGGRTPRPPPPLTSRHRLCPAVRDPEVSRSSVEIQAYASHTTSRS